MSDISPYARHGRVVAEMGILKDEIRELAGRRKLSASEESRLETLEADFEALSAEAKAWEREALQRRVDAFDGSPLTVQHGHTPRSLDDDPLGEPRSLGVAHTFSDPWSIVRDDSLASRNAGPAELRSRALSAAEKAAGANDAGRAAMTKVIEEDTSIDAALSRLALITSDPDYVAAWAELLRTGGLAPILSEPEVLAIRRMRELQRAMSLTDSGGGYLVPFQLDPAVIITSDGSYNPFRAVSRVVQATGDTYNPVSAGATVWSWDAENSEVSDDTSTFVQPSVTVHTGRGFVPFSIQVGEDAPNLAEEVSRLLSFGRATLESQAFAIGSGSGEPFGIVTALAGTASVVSATTNNSFGPAVDVYKLDEALPARYRSSRSSAWFGHRTFLNDISQAESANGARLFPDVLGNPGTLLGVAAYESEAMDAVLATGDDYILVFGDFSNYLIADRSTSVEFIPHLFHTTSNRPSGTRGFYAYHRVGAGSVNDAGFRMLLV
jgi:HK97 family phage major capsid protein